MEIEIGFPAGRAMMPKCSTIRQTNGRSGSGWGRSSAGMKA